MKTRASLRYLVSYCSLAGVKENISKARKVKSLKRMFIEMLKKHFSTYI